MTGVPPTGVPLITIAPTVTTQIVTTSRSTD
jgi:hypothetical protein